MACLGNTVGLAALQTETGIKDKISIYWLDQLVPRAQAMQKTHDSRLNDKRIKNEARVAVKEEITKAIQKELWDWVVTQPDSSHHA